MGVGRLRAIRPPSNPVGYRVVVVPNQMAFSSCWEFAVLISMEDQHIAYDIVSQICGAVLAVGDTFYITKIEDLSEVTDDDLPIMSYDSENPDIFDWMIVPERFKN